MIEGKVTEALDPIVEIGLKREESTSTIEAIVDTGFTGYLCLSERWVDKLDMTFKFVERYEMANGDLITWRSLLGLGADLGPAPSGEEIDGARREAWANFPREDISCLVQLPIRTRSLGRR